jgi:hypothetical protein
MAENKKQKFLCGTEPWVSADITEKEYKEWIASIKKMKVTKIGD